MMDDNQLAYEDKLRRQLAAAIANLRLTIIAVNHGSCVTEIDRDAFEAFIHDEMPSDLQWDERAHQRYVDDRWAMKGVRL
jgi:hypothetical protein